MRSAWSSLRGRLPMAEAPTFIGVFALAMVVTQSTVTMNWVQGSGIFLVVTALAVAGMGMLALIRPLPAAFSLALGGAGAVAVPYWLTAAALVATHPDDALGIPSPGTWITRISGREQNVDAALFLFLICIVMWLVAGWLTYCVLRWRRTLLGIFPGAAVFATNVLNSKDEQNANTIYFLILTVAIMLWSNYRGSVVSAARAGLRMSSDSRWDFWETGVAATAGVLLLAIFLPPLAHEDLTVNVESGPLRNWAEFQQNLNHQVQVGRGGPNSFSTGFSTDAGLNGPLTRSDKLVMIYTVEGSYFGPRYMRGVNLQTGLRLNQWAYQPNQFGFQYFIGKGENLPYGDIGLREQSTATIRVHMIRPPARAPDLLFYPGELLHSDRDSVAVESLKNNAVPQFGTVDKVASSHPATSAGFYKALVQYPNPTEEELRAAGTDYPVWVDAYRSYPGTSGLVPVPGPTAAGSAIGAPPAPFISAAQKIKALADGITAQATNPYDKAMALESFLRAGYTYTLTPKPATDTASGQDPVSVFLFDTKQGYCEYFASALGDLMRAEGIPTRLVSGFGPGNYDAKGRLYTIRESDAHTWVEAYFPHYGWIPFEPTPDGQYFPIIRASTASTCTRDQCSTGSDTLNAEPGSGTVKKGVKDLGGDVPEQTGGLAGASQPPYWAIFPALLILLLAGGFIYLSRFLRPRTAGQAWHRLSFVSRLAGVDGGGGETPNEFGRRVAAAFPEAAGPVRELTDSFTVAVYGPPEMAGAPSRNVVESWTQVRPLLMRRVLERLRPAW
ncbi:MAG: transglutaminaseTgpA domain-containing protein [Candidatus Dormibacteraceae bacterium]